MELGVVPLVIVTCVTFVECIPSSDSVIRTDHGLLSRRFCVSAGIGADTVPTPEAGNGPVEYARFPAETIPMASIVPGCGPESKETLIVLTAFPTTPA